MFQEEVNKKKRKPVSKLTFTQIIKMEWDANSATSSSRPTLKHGKVMHIDEVVAGAADLEGESVRVLGRYVQNTITIHQHIPSLKVLQFLFHLAGSQSLI